MYATTKKEKLRAYLACFDAEVLLYSVTNIETQTPCLLVFLSSLRYLAKNIKLKDWEGKKYLTGAAVFLRYLEIKIEVLCIMNVY